MKRKKKQTSLLQEEKKGKNEKFALRPPGIKPRPTDSESDVLTTLPSMYMAFTRDQVQNTCD